MDFLLIFLIFPLLLSAALSQKYKGHRRKSLLLFIGVPFVIFFGDEIVGQGYLYTQCALNSGYQYKEPIRADGYFDADETKGCSLGCLEALTRQKFLYYESEVRDGYPYHATTPGFYKYYLVNKDTGLCAGGRAIPRERGAYGLLPGAKCVAYEKLAAPSSRYEVSMIRTTDVVRSPFRLQKVFSYIKDRKTNAIVASATSYMYWGGWVRNSPYSVAHNSATVCPSFRKSHAAIEDIIFTSNAK
jgi:hypothetical protein